MRYLSSAVLLATLLSATASAQSISQYRFSSITPASEGVLSTFRDASGNTFFVSNAGRSTAVIKCNSAGALQWRRVIDEGTGFLCSARSARLTANGDVDLLITASPPSASVDDFNSRIVLARVSGADGSIAKNLVIPPPENMVDTRADVDTEAAWDLNGNTFVLTTQRNTSNVPNRALVKFDPNGVRLWTTILPTQRYPEGFVLDGAGNPIVYGSRYAADNTHNGIAAWKYSASDGSASWSYERLPDPTKGYGYAQGISFDGSGKIILTGSEYLNSSDSDDAVVSKLDPATGAANWESKNRLSSWSDGMTCSTVDPASGDIITGGYSVGVGSITQPALMRLNAATGSRVWVAYYSSLSAVGYANNIKVDGQGGVVATYYTYSSSPAQTAGLMRFNLATGALLWGKRYPSAKSSRDFFRSVDIVGNDAVLLGYTDIGMNVITPTNAKAVDCDPLSWTVGLSDGTVKADQPLSTVEEGEDQPIDVAGAPNGGHAVLEEVTTGYGQDDYQQVVMFNSDNSIRWAARAPVGMKLKFLKIDAAGNVAVTGQIFNAGSNDDIAVGRYRAADGALLWTATYAATNPNSSDEPVSIGTLSNGDVVVYGHSQDNIPTICFDAATGARKWLHTHISDFPTVMAISTGDDVYVASSVIRSQTYVIRLSGATGAEQWRTGYTDATYPAASALGLALLPGGDPFVYGACYNLNGQRVYYVLRLDGTSGSKLYSRNLSTKFDDNYSFMGSVGPNGDAYLVGKDAYSPDLRVVRIRTADGSNAWETFYNHPANIIDQPVGVVVNSLGDLFVAGRTGDNTNANISNWIAKFDAATGVQSWGQDLVYGGATNAALFRVVPLVNDTFVAMSTGLFGDAAFGPSVDLFFSKVAMITTQSHTVSGTVALGDFAGDVTQVPVTIEIRAAGSSTVLSTQTVTLSSTGAFSATANLPSGSYDVYVKASHWLRKKVAGVSGSTLTLGTVSLINGDVNGDNQITATDNSILSAAYRSRPTSANWDARADLNGDGQVSATDASILSRNFRTRGD